MSKPFSRRTISGCRPIGKFSICFNVIDNIDLWIFGVSKDKPEIRSEDNSSESLQIISHGIVIPAHHKFLQFLQANSYAKFIAERFPANRRLTTCCGKPFPMKDLPTASQRLEVDGISIADEDLGDDRRWRSGGRILGMPQVSSKRSVNQC